MRTYKDYCGQHAIRISICMAFLALLITPISSQGIEARIKDISRVARLAEVEIIGSGTVSSRVGTGDKDLMLTKQTVANLMENFQIQLSSGDIKSKNVAAVAVIARVPPFHKANDRVDIK